MSGARGSIGELIVVGAGAAGLSAALAGARLGFSVTCIEARRIGHAAASSSGWVKILRYAYEDHRFSKLLVDAEERWRELEERSGRRLIERCESLNIAKASSQPIQSLMFSLDTVGRNYEILRPGDSRLTVLGILLLPDEEAVLEIGAGVVRPGTVLTVLTREARRNGVRIMEGETVRTIEPEAGGLRVETRQHRLRADRVIVAAGPWVHDLIPAPPSPLTVTEQPQLRFATDRPIGAGRPLAWAELVRDDGYGVVNGHRGRHIIGSHAPTHTKLPVGRPSLAPDEVLRRQIATFRKRVAADLQVKIIGARICRYTRTNDADFLVTRCTDTPGVVLLSACSGHGFKFALTTGHQAAALAAS